MHRHFTNTAKAWPTSTLGAAPGDEDAQNKLVDALQVLALVGHIEVGGRGMQGFLLPIEFVTEG